MLLQVLLRTTTSTTTTEVAAILTTFARRFSSTTTKPFSNIPLKHRSKAIQESQKALSDYLHATRSLPFLYADNIARNSPQSLWRIVSEIPFSPPTFAHSFQRFLRYHPINELDFFFESIGLNLDENGRNPRFIIPPNTFFLSDWEQFDVACALAGMGFPWCKLGLLCRGECSIFASDLLDLKRKFSEIKDGYAFNSTTVISICLAFPWVLYSNGKKTNGLLSDLKILFLDYDLWSSVEGGNVDSMFDICEKIKSFYDLGCEMGELGELMGRSKNIFIEYSKEFLISKIEYFRKLNVPMNEIGTFLLSKPEIFSLDLETRVISVSGFLDHLGLSGDEMSSLKEKYPHVFGRNKVANLCGVMRSMNLGEWFFEKMKNGDNHSLLATYTICCTEDLDKHYQENFRRTLAKRNHVHAIKKLSFLHSIGFGENKYAVKALALLHSSGRQLQRRFDCLLSCGIKYSNLCEIVRSTAKILNQEEKSLEKKIKYLCNDMGSSLEYLDSFPGYLCYNLEKRIKPRYEFHKWLVEKDLRRKEYSLSTIIASSEKAYIARISRINCDAAKMWEERRVDRVRNKRVRGRVIM
ncbi:hypothetical protein OROHE_004926 [Orobanche hederae]